MSKTNDALDDLAMAVYGRKAEPKEWAGGSQAKILSDAAKRIRVLESEYFGRSYPDRLNQSIGRCFRCRKVINPALDGAFCSDECRRVFEIECEG